MLERPSREISNSNPRPLDLRLVVEISDTSLGFDLTKNGAGVLTLKGSNTFSGSLIVTAGTVNIDGDDRFNGISGLSLAAGSTLDLNDFSDSLGVLSGAGTVTFGTIGGGTLTVGAKNTNSVFSGIITGAGDFVKTGAGTLTDRSLMRNLDCFWERRTNSRLYAFYLKN